MLFMRCRQTETRLVWLSGAIAFAKENTTGHTDIERCSKRRYWMKVIKKKTILTAYKIILEELNNVKHNGSLSIF